MTRRQPERKHSSAGTRRETRGELETGVGQHTAPTVAAAIPDSEWVEREHHGKGGGLLRPVRMAPGPTALTAFAVLGVGVSIYLTVVHYAGAPLVCTTSGIVDCAAVTSSTYSMIPATSVPITLPGIAWFLGSGALGIAALIAAMRGSEEPAWLRGGHVLLGVTGLAGVLYLVYVEAVLLHRLCEWCTVLHLLVFATLLVALARLQHAPPSGGRHR